MTGGLFSIVSSAAAGTDAVNAPPNDKSAATSNESVAFMILVIFVLLLLRYPVPRRWSFGGASFGFQLVGILNLNPSEYLDIGQVWGNTIILHCKKRGGFAVLMLANGMKWYSPFYPIKLF